MTDPLPAEALRWRCDPASLPFETTAEVEPVAGVVGQQSAVEALRFGIESDAPGQNVFVRGLAGTGRMTMVRRLLDELMPSCPIKQDRCYVHNFKQPDRPRLITVPPQRGRELRRQVQELSDFVRKGLSDALESDAVRARREAVEAEGRARLDEITDPFEESLKAAGLALVSMQQGPLVQAALFPVVDGKTIQPDEYEELHAKGEITDEDREAFKRSVDTFQKQLGDVTLQVQRIRRETGKAVRTILEETARRLLEDQAVSIRESFPGEDVATFLDEVVDDVIERLTSPPAEGEDPTRLYGVNILMEHDEDPSCPIVVENAPTLANLLGTVEREWSPRGATASDYSMIRAGSLLRADGGYLIVDARDLLGEPGAWKVLVRTLRHGTLEIVPPEMGWPFLHQAVKPQPIPISVRVILVGDAEIYYLLDQHDPDFGHLFKVLADFDNLIDREPDGVRQYAGVLARIAAEESLPAFDRTAVAALAEHGARVASHRGRLTARFARIADIAREAAFLARKEERPTVTAADVSAAVQRTKRRADLPSRRFQRLLAEGTIIVQTDGEVVGQINGLAVMSAGMLTYGFPARITATIGPGGAGIVDIEGSASLSGAIHTKGFHILGGCLRHLLQTDHALAFSASLAFEQSYGGIDGDSASGAEICCLLSALTGMPIRQRYAMTGAIDQHGRIQAIGGVNEKIEGFFDTCAAKGLTGNQGVIIPETNAGDLMLRADVAAACADGHFHVFAVDSVRTALEILTGTPAGERDESGMYPEGTLLYEAVEKAHDYWEKSLLNPIFLEEEDEAPESTAEHAPERPAAEET